MQSLTGGCLVMHLCCLKLKMLGCMKMLAFPLPALVHIDDQPMYIHYWSFPDKRDTKLKKKCLTIGLALKILNFLFDNWPGTDLHVVFGSRREQARHWRSFYQPWSTLTASPCMSSTDLFLTKETLKFVLFSFLFLLLFPLCMFFSPSLHMNILKHVWKSQCCQVCWARTVGNRAIENYCVSIIFLYFLMIVKMATQ